MSTAGRMCALLAVGFGVAGCNLASPSPVPPTQPPSTESGALAVFMDRTTGFSTSDVPDADDQILRFNSNGELIWLDGETRFDGYIADGQVITADRVCDACYFFVRFGTRDGEGPRLPDLGRRRHRGAARNAPRRRSRRRSPRRRVDDRTRPENLKSHSKQV